MAETEGEHACTGQLGEGLDGERAPPAQAIIDRGHTTMSSKGYVQGEVVILKDPLAVPDGTEVDIVIPPANDGKRQGRGKSSVAQATCGIMPSDPAVVHAVLEEAVYDT
jgi:hypothetical protein